jgi:small-conductance mechanosensitive channel
MAVILVITLLAILSMVVMRFTTIKHRLVLDIFLISLLTAGLYWKGQTAFLFIGSGTSSKSGPWDQLLAAGWWLVAARLVASLLGLHLGHDQRTRETRLFSDLLSGCVYVGAALIVLNFVLRLPLAGLLATSGIVAIVLGLALQNTLADVFSGIAVGVAQPFKVGDRIKLGRDIEGVVEQINWRSIHVLTDEDDLAIVPNSAVARADLVNRSSPTLRRMGKIELMCPTSLAPASIERLLNDATLLCPMILPDPPCAVSLTRLGLRTSTYAVAFAVSSANQLASAKSALRHQVWRQFHHHKLLDGSRFVLEAPQYSLDLLRSISVFQGLSEENLNELHERIGRRELASGEILFNQGDLDSCLYIVADGVVELSQTREDGTVDMAARIGVGEYIGEIGVLTGAAKPVTATAYTRACVHVLMKDALQPMLTENPDLAAAFENSVMRGRALLEQHPTLGVLPVVQGRVSLLAGIRNLFQL